MLCVGYAMYAMRDGQAGRSACAGVCTTQIRPNGQVCAMQQAKPAKWAKIALKMAENRGVSVILYDGFRKCFVNCKFTFYIILSSYLKKVKIPKTRKRHSKM